VQNNSLNSQNILATAQQQPKQSENPRNCNTTALTLRTP